MTKQELKKLIAQEMHVYGITKKNILEKSFRHQKSYMIWQAVKRLRIYEYRCSRRDESKNPLTAHLRAFRVKIADRKLNKACEKVDVELTPNMIGKNIQWHDGSNNFYEGKVSGVSVTDGQTSVIATVKAADGSEMQTKVEIANITRVGDGV